MPQTALHTSAQVAVEPLQLAPDPRVPIAVEGWIGLGDALHQLLRQPGGRRDMVLVPQHFAEGAYTKPRS